MAIKINSVKTNEIQLHNVIIMESRMSVYTDSMPVERRPTSHDKTRDKACHVSASTITK